MKNPNYKGIELLPLSVIEAARAGDTVTNRPPEAETA